MFSFNAPFYGSTGGIHLNQPVVGSLPSRTEAGTGWWPPTVGCSTSTLPSTDRPAGTHLNAPIVAGLNNNSYDGYWLTASDGGVFTFSPPNEGMPFFGSAA